MNDRKKAVHVGTVVLETVKDHLWLSFGHSGGGGQGP